jgi:hypothetical protein
MMKVLVSTRETQGFRKSDFCFVPEGELVGFGMECDGEKVDGGCGCRRSMVGLLCMKATTTIAVCESELTEEYLFKKIMEHLEKSGWAALMKEETEKNAKADLRSLVRLSEIFPSGSIIEKRGTQFMVRKATVDGYTYSRTEDGIIRTKIYPNNS